MKDENVIRCAHTEVWHYTNGIAVCPDCGTVREDNPKPENKDARLHIDLRSELHKSKRLP